MGVTFPVVVEPGGTGLGSKTTDWTVGRTKHVLDTGDYDGSPVYWFEINVINLDTHSAGREVRLVDSGGTAKCTITVPASTGTAGNYTRIRSTSSFTPVTGSEEYRIELEGTTTALDLQVIRWRWIIFQTNADKTRICYPMGFADLAGCNNVETGGAAPLWGTGHGSYLTDNFNVQNMFKYVEGQFAGDTVQYEWECCAYYNGSDPTHGHVGLLAHDDSDPVNAVLAEILVDEGATQDVYRVTIDQESEYWVDGMDFEFSVKGEQFLRNCQVYNCAIYITITGLSKVRTYWCLHGGWNGLTAHDAEEGRMLYTASDYQEPTPIYAACVSYIGGSAGNGHEFNHFGTSDGPGGTGTQLLEYQSPSGGDKDYQEWSAGTLTDGYRYGGGFWRTNNAMEICSQFLIFEMEFEPDAILEVEENFTLADAPDTPYRATLREIEAAGDAFTLVDAPEFGETWAFEELEATDNFTLADAPEIDPPVEIHYLEPDPENFTLADSPIEWDKGEAFGPKTLVIAEVELTPGTEYVAGKGVVHPDRYYRGVVHKWGTVTRSVPVPVGLPHIGDAVVELVDVDNGWRAAFAGVPPQNRKVTLKIGPEGGSESLFYVAYTGLIKHADTQPGLVRVYLRDATFQFLDEDLPDLLTREVYDDPLLGDNLVRRTAGTYEEEEVFSPIPIGVLESSDPEVVGAMNAVRISDTTYNLAQYPIPHDPIVLYGKGQEDTDFVELTGGYSIVEEAKTVAGRAYTFTHVEFSSARGDGYEVRWDGHGMTDDGTKDGLVIRNHAEAVRQYLIRIVGKDESELNKIRFDRAVELLDAVNNGNLETSGGDGLLCDGVIQKRITHGVALTRLMRPILIMFVDKKGLYSIRYIGDTPSDMPQLDDVQDIFVKTEQHDLGDPVHNVINYQFARSFSTQTWSGKESLRDTDSIDRYQKEVPQDVPLWFARDPLTAQVMVREYLEWTQPESYRIMFTTAGHRRIPYIELTDFAQITQYAGFDETGGGYVDKEFMVHRTEFNLDDKTLRVHAIARVPAIETMGGLNGAETPDSRIGPYYYPGGKFFAVTRGGGFYWQTQGELDMWGSSDYGRTWAKLDDGNQPSYMEEGLHIMAHDCFPDRQDPAKLLCVTQRADGVVHYHKFDMVNGVWDFTDRVVWSSVSNYDGAWMAQVDRSRRIGRLGVFYFREDDPQNSGFGEDATRTAFAYSDDDGLTWSTPQDVGADTTSDSKWGQKYTYAGGRIVAGSEDRFHFFYQRSPSTYNPGVDDGFFRTARNDGSLGPEVKFLEPAGGLYYPAGLNFGRIGERWREDGELELAIPMKSGGPCGAGGGFWWQTYESGESLILPGENGGFRALCPWIINQGLGNANPAATIEADPWDDSWHLFSAGRTTMTLGSNTYNSVTLHFSGSGTCSPTTANLILGWPAAFMAMTAYWKVVTILGQIYIAQLTHGKPGTSWDWVFTLVRLEDLPQPVSWDEIIAEVG